MLDEKDLQAISKLLEPINKRLDTIDERLERLEESQEETRSGVNSLLEWAEECGNVIKFPLPKVK
jgi:hypothetical protein